MQVLSRRQFGKRSLAAVATVAIASTGDLALTGCSTTWITTIEDDLPEIVNIVSSILAFLGPAGTGALIIFQAAVTAFQASLSAFQDAVNAYKASESQGTLNALIAALQAAQADAGKVVASLPSGIVSQAIETAIVAGMGLAITILSAIQTIIPGAAPAAVTLTATASAVKAKTVLPNAAAIRFSYNAVLSLNGLAAHQIG